MEDILLSQIAPSLWEVAVADRDKVAESPWGVDITLVWLIDKSNSGMGHLFHLHDVIVGDLCENGVVVQVPVCKLFRSGKNITYTAREEEKIG